MSIVVCGIDPSISCTAIASGSTPDAARTETFATAKASGDGTLQERLRRYEATIAKIDRHLADIKPSLILIEAYAFSSNGKGQMFIGEFGGLLRWHALDRAPEVLEVAPACLKKFTTGVGNADKQAMVNAVGQRWGKFFKTVDEVDAYALWRMALVIAGTHAADNDAQRQAVAKVIGTRRLSFNPAPASEPALF